MTRFARAKGSKASNERAPEDGTPWEVMKEQLLQAKKEGDESKKRKEAEKQRIENYENFLKEHKVQKRKATWCDFPEVTNNKKANNLTDTNEPSVKNKNKNKKKLSGTEQSDATSSETNPQNPDNSEVSVKKSKKKNKNLKATVEPQNENHSMDGTETIQNNKNNKKKNKNKKKLKFKSDETNSKDYQLNNESSAMEGNEKNNNSPKPKNKEVKAKKNIKFVDGKPVRRKEINDHSFQLIVNGKEIELVRYDGFPVMKKDAERLQELKINMIKKGIPKSEIQRTMKLERRRAEKALARMKREVCYNCRKGGHVLSDCPELKSKIPGADAAEGVCFKCGSTEHRQFECKVQQDKEFRFATCFICKEPGHIARQCPDNPKGLYPNGGCCKLCGDVTHLRKDCPTVMDKKEESTVKLHTLNSSENIEDVGQQTFKHTPTESHKKPKKIKF